PERRSVRVEPPGSRQGRYTDLDLAKPVVGAAASDQRAGDECARGWRRVSSCAQPPCDKAIQPGQRVGQVRAAETDPEMIAGVIVKGTRQEEDPFLFNQLSREALDRQVGREAREADAAGAWADPLEHIGPRGEET